MAAITEKLTQLEAKIGKRKEHIRTETEMFNANLTEYDKLYLLALADKFKLKGKDLISLYFSILHLLMYNFDII